MWTPPQTVKPLDGFAGELERVPTRCLAVRAARPESIERAVGVLNWLSRPAQHLRRTRRAAQSSLVELHESSLADA
jgi:hypothetical protein